MNMFANQAGSNASNPLTVIANEVNRQLCKLGNEASLRADIF
jgi:hypothetical protein